MMTGAEAITIKSFWYAIRWLPGVLFRRRFSRQRLAASVYVDLRPRDGAVTINLGECAEFQVWMHLLNQSPFDLELDRAELSLQCGAEIKATILVKRKILAGERVELHFKEVIPDGVATHIARSLKNQNQIGLVGNIEFNCKVQPFAREIGYISNFTPYVLNAQSRLVAPRPS